MLISQMKENRVDGVTLIPHRQLQISRLFSACTLIQNIAYDSGLEEISNNFFSLWQAQALPWDKMGETLILRIEPSEFSTGLVFKL